MTYEEAVEKVIDAFSELSDEEQVDMIEQHLGNMGDDVAIFPMTQFDAFCKNWWDDHYSDFAEVMMNTKEADNYFTLSDNWCLYNKSTESFVSADTPFDFAFSDDNLADTLLDDTDFLLDVLGFDWADINEMRDAFLELGEGMDD